MRKLLLLVALNISVFTFGQTTLFTEDFESGTANWTFNGSGANAWVVNALYAGFAPLIVDTPNEPGNVQTNYLHINNATACGSFGACNANFDTGSASNQNADMASGVSTVGMSNITIGYIYLCAGAAATSYGTMEYSTDGGSTWTVQETYSGVSSWTTESSTNPAWAQQADLRFRFKWQNGTTGLDPSFSVDDVVITGTSACSNTASEITESACFEYLSPDGSTYTSTGQYFDTIPNALGCDSVITINLTINTVDNGVNQTNETMVSTASSANYQWLDCDNNYAQIGGETGQTFIATSDGNYAVQVMENGCTDTSACYTVAGLGIDEKENEYLAIYPNPVSNELTILSSAAIETVKVYNSLGQIVLTEQSNKINVSALRRGLYIVDITTESGVTTKRFIKK